MRATFAGARFCVVLTAVVLTLTSIDGCSHQSPTACTLFTPKLARRLVGPKAQRFRIESLLPASPTADQRTRAAQIAAKTCAYLPPGAPLGRGAALQLDRNRFHSTNAFYTANSISDGAKRISGIGKAAMVLPSQGGWAIAVLGNRGYSFLLAGSSTASRSEVIAVGRKIAAKLAP